MKNLKTYEKFNIRNIFQKNHGEELIMRISSLAQTIFKDSVITIENSLMVFNTGKVLQSAENTIKNKDICIDRDKYLHDLGNLGNSLNTFTGRWCFVQYRKNNEFFIHFNPNLEHELNYFISDILQSFQDKKTHPIVHDGISTVTNNKIPEIIEQLTPENYEKFQNMKKI